MKAINPPIAGCENVTVMLGASQPEYNPLPALVLKTQERHVITRWEFSDEEREAIANGADLVIQTLTFGHAFQPINMQVLDRDELPDISTT